MYREIEEAPGEKGELPFSHEAGPTLTNELRGSWTPFAFESVSSIISPEMIQTHFSVGKHIRVGPNTTLELSAFSSTGSIISIHRYVWATHGEKPIVFHIRKPLHTTQCPNWELPNVLRENPSITIICGTTISCGICRHRICTSTASLVITVVNEESKPGLEAAAVID